MPEHVSRRDLMRSFGVGGIVLSLGCATGRAAAPRGGPGSTPKPYELPPLPYRYDGLAPAISETVLRVHHSKHHAGYVTGLNATLKKLAQARASGDLSQIKALSRALAFHGSGHVLHSLYWRSMKPGGSAEPTGAFRTALERDFGTFDAFKAEFLAATKKVEGSGWGLLAYEPMGARLLVLQAEKHQNRCAAARSALLPPRLQHPGQRRRRHGVPRSNDTDFLHFSHDTYSYCWPRDGALVAHALHMAGYSELTRRFFQFCAGVVRPEGYLMHKYNPDGTVASSWHPWVSTCSELPIQEHESALVLWALWQHYVRFRDIEFIRPLYRPLIVRVGDFLESYRHADTGPPLPSWDLWEERCGVHALTIKTAVGGIASLQRFHITQRSHHV